MMLLQYFAGLYLYFFSSNGALKKANAGAGCGPTVAAAY
jgi:hypothetical protein